MPKRLYYGPFKVQKGQEKSLEKKEGKKKGRRNAGAHEPPPLHHNTV